MALKNEKWKVKENVISPSSRFTERQLFYSKKNPIAEAKKDNIDNLVHQIEQHPLAIYSHLEESLPPDVTHTLKFISLNSLTQFQLD